MHLDDPLFDPWGVEAEEPAAPRLSPRWRAPSGPGPQAPTAEDQGNPAPGRSAAAAPASSPAPPTPAARPPQRPARARLAGAAGFLRTMAVPRLERMVARLQLARHQARVEDQLDASVPAVRFEARLYRGPWSPEADCPAGILELSLPEAGGSVRVRTWLGNDPTEPHSEVSIPPARLDARTVERLAIGVLEDLVDRS